MAEPARLAATPLLQMRVSRMLGAGCAPPLPVDGGAGSLAGFPFTVRVFIEAANT